MLHIVYLPLMLTFPSCLPSPHATYPTDHQIVLIELLLCDCFGTKMSLPMAARGLVDDFDSGTEGADELAAAIKRKQKATETDSSMPASTWRESGGAKRAAKLLIDAACACTRVTSKRQAPAQALVQLEAAAEIAKKHRGEGERGSSWLGSR